MHETFAKALLALSDPNVRRKFNADVHSFIREYGLSETDRLALLSGDSAILRRQALYGDLSSTQIEGRDAWPGDNEDH